MIEQWKDEVFIDEFGCIKSGGDELISKICSFIKMPDESEIVETVKSMDKSRPRVVCRKDKLKALKNKNETNVRFYNKLKAYAESYKTNPVACREDFSTNLLFAREVLDRAFVMGYMYQSEGGWYAQALKDQIFEALKLYDGFNLEVSDDVLPCCELTVAICVAYDWIYDTLSADEKAIIRNSVANHAEKSLSFYTPVMKNNACQVNNWNAVFSGSNIVAGLTMYGEDESDLWEKLVAGAVRSITLPVSEFCPNGGFPEGLGYWVYQSQYIIYGVSSLDCVLGTDFNLSRMPGFDKAGLTPVYMSSNTFNGFNFADSSEGRCVMAFMNWYGAKFNMPELFAYNDAAYPDGVNYSSWMGAHYDLITMIHREDTKAGSWKSLPKSYWFMGRQPVMTIRNSWDEDAAFIAFKGGYNQLPHGNLDIGTFVYDWNKIRWFIDIGGTGADYSLEGYWDFKSGRWQYYSQRAEGHNTLVVNPDENPDQYIYASAGVEPLDRNKGIADITEAYPDLEKGTRTFELDGDTAIITDNLTLREDGEIYWFMHTKAQIEIVSDNSADLTMGKSKIKVEFELPEGAKISVMDAKPLNVRPDGDYSKYENIKKICVHACGNGDITLVTKIIPLGVN